MLWKPENTFADNPFSWDSVFLVLIHAEMIGLALFSNCLFCRSYSVSSVHVTLSYAGQYATQWVSCRVAVLKFKALISRTESILGTEKRRSSWNMLKYVETWSSHQKRCSFLPEPSFPLVRTASSISKTSASGCLYPFAFHQATSSRQSNRKHHHQIGTPNETGLDWPVLMKWTS